MAAKMFVNLAVKDLNRSVEFFTKLGFDFDPRFTNEKATSMIVGGDNYVHLLVESFFKTFINTELCDATKCTEVIVAIALESREKVNEVADAAFAAGATSFSEAQDHGWMFLRKFVDLDGHVWEIFSMDVSAMPQS